MEFDIIVRIICISSILILNIDKIVWQNYLLVIAVISNVLSIYLGPFIVCPILPRVRSRVYLGRRQRCFLYDPSEISIPLHTSTSKNIDAWLAWAKKFELDKYCIKVLYDVSSMPMGLAGPDARTGRDSQPNEIYWFIDEVFTSAITFWIMKFPSNSGFSYLQKLQNRVALPNRVPRVQYLGLYVSNQVVLGIWLYLIFLD
jgi:hypothetical protein